MGLGWVSLCGGDERGASSFQGESTLPRSVLGRIHRRSRPRSRGLGSMCRFIPLSANTHDNTVGYGDARQGDPQHGTRPSSVYNDCEAVGFISSLKVQSSPMKYSDAPLRVFRVLATYASSPGHVTAAEGGVLLPASVDVLGSAGPLFINTSTA